MCGNDSLKQSQMNYGLRPTCMLCVNMVKAFDIPTRFFSFFFKDLTT